MSLLQTIAFILESFISEYFYDRILARFGMCESEESHMDPTKIVMSVDFKSIAYMIKDRSAGCHSAPLRYLVPL